MQLGLLLTFAQLTKMPLRIRFLLDELPISVKSLVPFIKKECRSSLALFQIFLWDWIKQTGFQLRVEDATKAMIEERRRGQEEVVDDSELEG